MCHDKRLVEEPRPTLSKLNRPQPAQRRDGVWPTSGQDVHALFYQSSAVEGLLLERFDATRASLRRCASGGIKPDNVTLGFKRLVVRCPATDPNIGQSPGPDA